MSEYTIVENDHVETLINHVNTLIAEGWKPYGDLIITTDVSESRSPRTKYKYHQAMTK